MPVIRHRCYLAEALGQDPGSIGCVCTTNRDHDEGSMDLPNGPYWLAGLAPDGWARREQDREQLEAAHGPMDAREREMVDRGWVVATYGPAPQDARPTTPQPDGPPLHPTVQLVTATLNWRSDREATVLYRAPDGITYEAEVRDTADGDTAQQQAARLLAHEQALYEARAAAGPTHRVTHLTAAPTGPQDAPATERPTP